MYKTQAILTDLYQNVTNDDDFTQFIPQTEQAKIMEKICNRLPNPLPQPIHIRDKFSDDLASEYDDMIQAFQDKQKDMQHDTDYECLMNISVDGTYEVAQQMSKADLKRVIKWLKCAINGELPPRKSRSQRIKRKISGVKPGDTRVQCRGKQPELYHLDGKKNRRLAYWVQNKKQFVINTDDHKQDLLKKIKASVAQCHKEFLKHNPYHLCYKVKIPIQEMMNQLEPDVIGTCKDNALDKSLAAINKLQQRHGGYVTDDRSQEDKIINRIILKHLRECLVQKYCQKHGKKYTNERYQKLMKEIKHIHKRVLERKVPAFITTMEARKRPLTYTMWKKLETRYQKLKAPKSKMKREINKLKKQLTKLTKNQKISQSAEKVLNSTKTSKSNLTKLQRYVEKYKTGKKGKR